MRCASSAAVIGVGVLWASVWARADEPPGEPVVFDRDVRPILQRSCWSCHGAEMQEAGLRLDRKDRALQGGDGGKVIVPGQARESRLIVAVAGTDADLGVMPPDGEGTPLSAAEVALLRRWIDQGAVWPSHDAAADERSDHWSFQPLRRAPPPEAADDAVRNAIDLFVLDKLNREGVTPSPAAAPETLLRRLHLDLLGLPPSPDVVDRFLCDDRPGAYERMVDELLASPHFGERWGRHWLDLARYADSDGYEKDRPRPHAWRYRQWVIDAINADLPYDQFSIAQLAGDLLAQQSGAAASIPEPLVASGFHRNTLHNTEGGIDPEEDRVKKTVDRTNTFGSLWLGLTVACAQCHSHKYDPLPQREYYQLYAYFNDIQEVDVDAPREIDRHQLDLARQRHEARLRELREQLARFDQQAATEGVSNSNHPDRQALQKQIDDWVAKAPQPPEAKAQAVAVISPARQTWVHLRGDFLAPGDAVAARLPAALAAMEPGDGVQDRLGLARWLFAESNPVAARVTVNRVWQRLFGRGLVNTLDDFGAQGEPPSHPELLDWLAAEFRRRGWSTKELIRKIALSRTYRQSSAWRTDLEQRDPENVWLARQVRRRVEAEVIRDLALAASGLWDARVGGPSVRPAQPAEYAELTYANSAKWTVSSGGDRYRRGLYTFFQRTSPYPMLATFDAPDSTETCPRRQTSNTPLQSLTLWNDAVFMECYAAFGRRVADETADSSFDEQLDRAYQLCFSRGPSDAERRIVRELHHQHLARLTAEPRRVDAILPSAVPDHVDRTNVATWALVGRTLMNLDEFITRE